MVAKFETVILGVADKVSERGNAYKLLSFMDEGRPVSAVVSAKYTGAVPSALEKAVVTVRAELGRYQKVEVLDIGRIDE